jgi:hypothetical protein
MATCLRRLGRLGNIHLNDLPPIGEIPRGGQFFRMAAGWLKESFFNIVTRVSP